MPQSLGKLEKLPSPAVLPLALSWNFHVAVGSTFFWPIGHSCSWLGTSPRTPPCPSPAPCNCLCCSLPAPAGSPLPVALAIGVELRYLNKAEISFGKKFLVKCHVPDRNCLTPLELAEEMKMRRIQEKRRSLIATATMLPQSQINLRALCPLLWWNSVLTCSRGNPCSHLDPHPPPLN